MKCSTGPTWDPKTTSWTDGRLDDTKHTLTFTPPVGALVCVTFPDATQPIEGVTTYTNKATINGASLEATATVKAAGGTDGNGSVKPAPAPSTEPTPEPKPEPKAEPKAEQPAPAPTTRLAKTGATLDGVTVALGSFALGALLAAAGYVINRRYLGGSGR